MWLLAADDIEVTRPRFKRFFFTAAVLLAVRHEQYLAVALARSRRANGFLDLINRVRGLDAVSLTRPEAS